MNKKIVTVCVLILIASAIVYYVYRSSNKIIPVSNTTQALSGIQTGDAPWIAEISHLRERLASIGLPALKEEGQALHIHEHIDIFIDGKLIVVPADIGVNDAEMFISSIHVHDDTAVIHVESPVVQTFTLGQFFDIWGVEFTNNSIGSYQNKEDKMLKVFVNGVEVKTDFRQIKLEAHQEIVVTFGTDKELPKLIPSTYKFAEGL